MREELKETSKGIVKKIYQLMYDFKRIVEKKGITYWTSGGTTLGVERHGGLIPWDDDLDVCMINKDRKKLLECEHEFEKNGYYMVKTWFGYKVCYKDGKIVEGEAYTFPNIDIFLMKKTEDKWEPIYKVVREMWPKEFYKEKDLFPLETGKFGEIEVPCPKESVKYLNNMYGIDWTTHAYRQYDHAKEEQIEKIKVKLRKEDYEPAKPTTIKCKIN